MTSTKGEGRLKNVTNQDGKVGAGVKSKVDAHFLPILAMLSVQIQKVVATRLVSDVVK